MSDPRIVPYGSWTSPVTSDLIVASTVGLNEILLDGTDVYWLESRPGEQGRSVIVRHTRDGTTVDVTPPVPSDGQSPFNVRTRVHEYGGGAYLVSGGVVYFSNDKDQRLYRQEPGGAPEALTQDPGQPMGLRYADGVMDKERDRMIWVREDHTTGTPQPVNTIVEIALDPSRPQRVLVSGRDFYACPRLSPDGGRLAWLEWHHPNMPWIGCELWVGEVSADGSIGQKKLVAGGDDEAVFQVEWSPDGTLYFISDRSEVSGGRWWNLYRAPGDPLSSVGDLEPVYTLAAEFGQPLWNFRMSTYAFDSDRRLICVYTENAASKMAAVDLASLGVSRIETPFSDISTVRARERHVYFRGGSPTSPSAVIDFDLATGTGTPLKISTSQDVEAFRGYLSEAEHIAFDTDNGQQSHGLFYAPKNPNFAAPEGQLPPLIVHCHGGPTSAASTILNWQIQYWTSRGFAYLDVDYGGSTGYGRDYRLRLQGNWGVVDVADSVNGAKHLARSSRVDPERWAISGGSAGGYTTLAVLTFRKEFKTGASYYGVSDLEALAKDTHKFESHYLDGLIGPYPDRRDLYQARSPVHFAHLLSVPVAFFQGAEDKIVPPEQAEAMVRAMREKRIPSLYLLFDGEQHGFRRGENIKRSLDGELYFYAMFLTDQRLSF